MSPLLTYTDDFTLPPLQWYQRSKEWCREMRALQPVVHHEKYGWLVFSYQETVQVFSEYATYSSETQRSVSTQQEEGRSIIMIDPPRHQQLRALITQAFSARTIAQMESRIQAIAVDLLDKMGPQVDFMDALAAPLPVMVIAEMLGLPTEDWPLFKKWTDAQVHHAAELDGTSQALAAYFFQHVERQRHSPGNGIINLLLNAEVDGKRLSPSELFSFFLTLLVAGNVTTTNLLGNAMLCFNLFPEALARLHEQPALIPSTIEEILRYMGPSRLLTQDPVGSRIALVDTELAGQSIRKGDVVRPLIFAANFDEQQFADAERFLLDRRPNRHIAFGHGIHFCLGAPLARLEARVVLTEMLKRFSSWEIINPDHLEQLDLELIFGVKHLPMTFQA